MRDSADKPGKEMMSTDKIRNWSVLSTRRTAYTHTFAW